MELSLRWAVPWIGTRGFGEDRDGVGWVATIEVIMLIVSFSDCMGFVQVEAFDSCHRPSSTLSLHLFALRVDKRAIERAYYRSIELEDVDLHGRWLRPGRAGIVAVGSWSLLFHDSNRLPPLEMGVVVGWMQSLSILSTSPCDCFLEAYHKNLITFR